MPSSWSRGRDTSPETSRLLVERAHAELLSGNLADRRLADVRALVRRIFEQYPDPPGLPPRNYDVHDRHAARRAILRRLRRVRS